MCSKTTYVCIQLFRWGVSHEKWELVRSFFFLRFHSCPHGTLQDELPAKSGDIRQVFGVDMPISYSGLKVWKAPRVEWKKSNIFKNSTTYSSEQFLKLPWCNRCFAIAFPLILVFVLPFWNGNKPNPPRQRWSIEALCRTYWAIIVHCMAVHVQGNGSKHYFSLIRFWRTAWCLLRGGHPKKSKWGMFLWGVSMVGKGAL